MRKLRWLLSLCAILLLCPSAFAVEGTVAGFEDVSPDDSFASAVEWAAKEDILTGISERAFSPNTAVTRGQAVTLLWRASGCPEPSGSQVPFADVTQDWAKDAVCWAAEEGITNGISASRFAPDDTVTRTQMAAFLYRTQGEPGKTGEGPWYSDAVKWAFDHVLIFGSALPMGSDGDDSCLRADAVTYLYRYFTSPAPEENAGDVIILYTSDVHCGIDKGFGYAGLAEIREALEDQGYATLLVDDGDSIQGESIGTLTKGEAIIPLMNGMAYDVVIPGNHEFDYGVDQFMKLTGEADFPYISCNFNKEGKQVFPSYLIKEAAGMKLAFVGVTTPKTLTSSTPVYFQNEKGEYIYDFLQDNTGEKVYSSVQKAVDSARAEGADHVVILGHLGLEEQVHPWTYADVIANTSGVDVFLDGHSHDTEQVVMKNKDGAEVIRSACGTKLANIGYCHISAENGVVESGLWSWTNPVSAPEALGLDNEIGRQVNAALGSLNDELAQVVGRSSVTLTVNDPEAVDASGIPVRMIRRAETNLGDFCADALRDATGSDIAVMIGGGIRSELTAGELTFGDILNVFPYGNQVYEIEVTGQQILDALEWGCRRVPGESGAFLHVSGLTYSFDPSIPSGCTSDENGMLNGISGPRRVKNVMVGTEPLDPGKTYTLGGTGYVLLENGDGQTAFDGAKILQDTGKLDSQAMIDYIVNALGGEIGADYADPYGQGRITILD